MFSSIAPAGSAQGGCFMCPCKHVHTLRMNDLSQGRSKFWGRGQRAWPPHTLMTLPSRVSGAQLSTGVAREQDPQSLCARRPLGRGARASGVRREVEEREVLRNELHNFVLASLLRS